MTANPKVTQVLVVLSVAVVFGTAPTHSEQGSVPDDLAGLAAFRLESHLGHRSVLLAEAIPADSYDWRPARGVRSVGELFKHLASANYWFCIELGADKPTDLPAWDELQSKDEIVDALERSVKFLIQTLKGLTEEDLDQEIDFYGRQTTNRELVLNAMTHGSEHLGQAIAYARSLGLTPPWSDG